MRNSFDSYNTRFPDNTYDLYHYELSICFAMFQRQEQLETSFTFQFLHFLDVLQTKKKVLKHFGSTFSKQLTQAETEDEAKVTHFVCNMF